MVLKKPRIVLKKRKVKISSRLLNLKKRLFLVRNKNHPIFAKSRFKLKTKILKLPRIKNKKGKDKDKGKGKIRGKGKGKIRGKGKGGKKQRLGFNRKPRRPSLRKKFKNKKNKKKKFLISSKKVFKSNRPRKLKLYKRLVLQKKVLRNLIKKSCSLISPHNQGTKVLFRVLGNLKRIKKNNPLTTFKTALDHLAPGLKVVAKIKAGKVNYYPTNLSQGSAYYLAMKWLLNAASLRDPKLLLTQKLGLELADTIVNKGLAFKSKGELAKVVLDSRVFAPFVRYKRKKYKKVKISHPAYKLEQRMKSLQSLNDPSSKRLRATMRVFKQRSNNNDTNSTVKIS